MKCNKCGLENPKQSEFCRKCGTSFGVHRICPQCGSENPGDSLYCIVCGARLSGIQKSVKGTQRKCTNCGHFNELDALFCVVCGEEMIKTPDGGQKKQSVDPSYRTIALVIGMIFLAGVLVKLGVTFSKRGSPSKLNLASVQTSVSPVSVDESQVIEVAKNFKCACGGCGELPLATCQCEMPKGSVEEKRFIREKLAEGFAVEQVIELVDKTYGHRA
jgi:uncharacterized membrane protein YvbJ